MPYFRMDWRVDQEALGLNLADIASVPSTGFPWTMGLAWDKKPPDPIRAEIDPKSGTDLPDAFLVGVPFLSEKLLGALERAGVGNVATFNAELVDPRTGTVHRHYKATNIIGAVSCADLERSEFVPGIDPPMMEFRHLVIDAQRARGLPLFRLAENTLYILVSAKVKQALEAAALVGLRFDPIEE